MDMNEVRDLLPLFAAGTLEPDQKQMVEEALRTSEELRKELEFWNRAVKAVAARHAESAAGHLSSQQIVDRALGALTGEELLHVDDHLRSCAACSEDLKQLNGTLESKRAEPVTWSYRVKNVVKSARLVYAVPALAVAVAIVLYVSSYWDRQSTPPPTKETTPPILVENQPTDGTTRTFQLSYRPEVRSTSEEALPVLTLEEKDRRIQVLLSIPRNAVSGIRYRVAVLSKGTTTYIVQDLIERYGSGAEGDSLSFVLPREALALPGGITALSVSEVLPEELNGLTPEEYHINFAVRAKR
jgi:hypothetical protein